MLVEYELRNETGYTQASAVSMMITYDIIIPTSLGLFDFPALEKLSFELSSTAASFILCSSTTPEIRFKPSVGDVYR